MARPVKSLHLTAVERQWKLKKLAANYQLRVIDGKVALREGTYDGGWIIPTIDILRGYDPYDDTSKHPPTMPDNLLAHKNKGAFRNTFQRASGHNANYHRHPEFYWSSTEERDYRSYVGRVSISNGNWNWRPKNGYFSSCRVVRLIPV